MKITKSSLSNILSPSDGGKINPESIVVLDNIERIANKGVCYHSEGDRQRRAQIAGYDHLKTTVYIDGSPYEVDMRVRVYDKKSGGDNRLYYFTPEEIVTVKKVGSDLPTDTLHERIIPREDAPTSSGAMIAREEPVVNREQTESKTVVERLEAQIAPVKEVQTTLEAPVMEQTAPVQEVATAAQNDTAPDGANVAQSNGQSSPNTETESIWGNTRLSDTDLDSYARTGDRLHVRDTNC